MKRSMICRSRPLMPAENSTSTNCRVPAHYHNHLSLAERRTLRVTLGPRLLSQSRQVAILEVSRRRSPSCWPWSVTEVRREPTERFSSLQLMLSCPLGLDGFLWSSVHEAVTAKQTTADVARRTLLAHFPYSPSSPNSPLWGRRPLWSLIALSPSGRRRHTQMPPEIPQLCSLAVLCARHARGRALRCRLE
jgi:hypothetical protein